MAVAEKTNNFLHFDLYLNIMYGSQQVSYIGYVKLIFTVFWEGKLVCPSDCSLIVTNGFADGKRQDSKIFTWIQLLKDFLQTIVEKYPDKK